MSFAFQSRELMTQKERVSDFYFYGKKNKRCTVLFNFIE